MPDCWARGTFWIPCPSRGLGHQRNPLSHKHLGGDLAVSSELDQPVVWPCDPDLVSQHQGIGGERNQISCCGKRGSVDPALSKTANGRHISSAGSIWIIESGLYTHGIPGPASQVGVAESIPSDLPGSSELAPRCRVEAIDVLMALGDQ